MRPKKNIYTIILTKNGKQIENLGTAPTPQRIYKKFNKFVKESNKVKIPVMWTHQNKCLVPTKYELYIIKYDDTTTEPMKLRNEFGKFVDYETSNSNWKVYDRVDYNKEETFWVYGYHPLMERKDYNWIVNNYIFNNSEIKSNFKELYVFGNKLIISCNGKINMVLTKFKDDCIRLYNTIVDDCTKRKIKNIMYCGDLQNSIYKHEWINKIEDLTGWDKTKILKSRKRNRRLKG